MDRNEYASRIEYVDIAKAIAIFMVLMGHTVSSDTWLKSFLYSFHMPLFFILSGIVFRTKKSVDRKCFCRIVYKRFTSLMVPYFVWGCVYSAFSFKNMLLIFYGTRETLVVANSLTSLWYLPVMFLSVLMVEKILSITNDKMVINVISVMLLLIIGFEFPHWNKFGVIWGADIAFIAAAFLIIGFNMRKVLDKYSNQKPIVFFVIAIVSAFFLYFSSKGNLTSVGYVLMANAIYGNPFLFVISAILGSISVISIAILLVYTKYLKLLLYYVGRNTLGIFLVHKPFVELGRRIVTKNGYDYNDAVFVFLISAIALMASCVVVYILKCFVPALLGKEAKVKEKGEYI